MSEPNCKACARSSCAKGCNDYFSECERLQSDLESLKRERAMLVEEVHTLAMDVPCEIWTDAYRQRYDKALSATEPQATQWMEDKIAEALNEQAEVWEIIGYSKFKTPAEELRLAASKRKEQV